MARLSVVLLLLLSACSVPGSQVSQGDGLDGTYVVNGIDPVGIEYSGTVIVDEGDDGAVTMEWLITGAILRGSGRLNDETIDMTWNTVDDARGAASGTATYTIEDDGRLVGTRTIDGVDGTGSEEIFPQG